MWRRLGWVVLLSVGWMVGIAAPLKPYRATYAIKVFGLTLGQAIREFTLTPDGHYRLTVHSWSTSSLFSMDITQTSEGLATTWQPLRYEFLQQRDDQQRHHLIDFDWQAAIAKSSYQGNSYSIPLTQGAQDKLSYQLDLQQRAAQDVHEFHYIVIEEKKSDDYRFYYSQREHINIGGKSVDTLKFIKQNDNNKRSTILWLAPDSDYLLVKLVHTERGVATTLLLTDYEYLS